MATPRMFHTMTTTLLLRQETATAPSESEMKTPDAEPKPTAAELEHTGPADDMTFTPGTTCGFCSRNETEGNRLLTPCMCTTPVCAFCFTRWYNRDLGPSPVVEADDMSTAVLKMAQAMSDSNHTHQRDQWSVCKITVDKSLIETATSTSELGRVDEYMEKEASVSLARSVEETEAGMNEEEPPADPTPPLPPAGLKKRIRSPTGGLRHLLHPFRRTGRILSTATTTRLQGKSAWARMSQKRPPRLANATNTQEKHRPSRFHPRRMQQPPPPRRRGIRPRHPRRVLRVGRCQEGHTPP